MAKRVMNNAQEIEERCRNIDPRSVTGSSALLFAEKFSTTRGVMGVKHTKQRVVLNKPEFPMVFTGVENEYGERSSWNIKAREDYQLMKIFRKFEDFPESTTAYIFKDLKTGKYLCKIVRPCEHLIEKYGFKMVNHMLNRMEGDILPKGSIIAQSTSYVNDNYCAGRNIRFAYAVLPELTEDALVISEDAAKELEYAFVDTVNVSLKQDSFLLNQYGDDTVYKPFPNIGEAIQNGILCSIRENSYVSSAYEASINHINDKSIFSDGIVSDIDIYSNADLENEQLNYYLSQIKRWYSDIFAYISAIISDPYQDDTSLLDIYQQAEKYLNNSTWVTKEYIEHVFIRFTVYHPIQIRKGQKVVGRYGNKSVIAKIVPTDQMPKTDDGRPIHMLANALAVPNRIIAFATYESTITFMIDRLKQRFKQMEEEGASKKEIVDLAVAFLKIFNDPEGEELKRLYIEHPDEIYNDIMKNGIIVQIEPFNGVCIRDSILKAYEAYPDIFKRYKMYTKLRHRWIELDGEYTVGYQYTWVLKQEPGKAMSVVSTGRTTPYDQPVKTHQYNKNLRAHSNNPIKFGEYDTYNFLAGVGVKAFSKISTFFRGSQYEDNSVLMSQLKNVGIDMRRYNKFPQLDNLKNVLRFIGVDLKPDIFGCRSIGTIDKTYEVMFNNCKLNVSIPELRYLLVMHSYFLRFQQEHNNGITNMDEFFAMIDTTDLFKDLPIEFINAMKERFVDVLPILQQLKQYD